PRRALAQNHGRLDPPLYRATISAHRQECEHKCAAAPSRPAAQVICGRKDGVTWTTKHRARGLVAESNGKIVLPRGLPLRQRESSWACDAILFLSRAALFAGWSTRTACLHSARSTNLISITTSLARSDRAAIFLVTPCSRTKCTAVFE